MSALRSLVCCSSVVCLGTGCVIRYAPTSVNLYVVDLLIAAYGGDVSREWAIRVET